MGDFVKVATTAEIPDGEGRVVEAGNTTLALFNVGGKYYALENTCPHLGGPLGEGSLDGQNVTCPWHGWQFNVCTGVSPVNPAAKQPTFEVKVEGTDILVKV